MSILASVTTSAELRRATKIAVANTVAGRRFVNRPNRTRTLSHLAGGMETCGQSDNVGMLRCSESPTSDRPFNPSSAGETP